MLQESIAALRNEMIHQREELTDALQAVERNAAVEAEQLREAVIAARRSADEAQQQHSLAAAQQRQRFDAERRELHDTIADLRRTLELSVEGGE